MTRVSPELAKSMIEKSRALSAHESFEGCAPVVAPMPENGRVYVVAPMPKIKRRWSNAKPVTVRGIKFPSKLEAAWWQHLSTVAVASGQRLYRQVRFPLLDIGGEDTGIPRYFSVDFVLRGGPGDRVIDAKGRESRDWARGKSAFEAEYGIQVEIVKRMPT